MSYLRIRLEGTLTVSSPTHIGTGEMRSVQRKMSENDNTEPESTEISRIARDCANKSYLPGSALRGVFRHCLLQMFRSLTGNIAPLDDDVEQNITAEKELNPAITQDVIDDKFYKSACLPEKVFGTALWAGKIECRAAPATSKIDGKCFKDKDWDQERQCYLVRSVAIDPVTGAAEAHKL